MAARIQHCSDVNEQAQNTANVAGGVVSPLVLADRLISLAQDADRAGLRGPAINLMRLAIDMCDERPRAPRRSRAVRCTASSSDAWPARDAWRDGAAFRA